MKSQFQTLSFLSNYRPKTDLDHEFIKSFLVQRFQITPKTPIFAPESTERGVDAQSFIPWFESGVAALKIARFNSAVVLLGNCTLDKCEIIASQLPDGSISTEVSETTPDSLQAASKDETDSFQAALCAQGLQPDPRTLRLVPKYIPEHGDRVIFYDYSLEVQGVGIVRSVDEAGDVTFFCYFTYPTSTQPKRIGFSLYDKPGYNLRSMVFENIDKENVMTTLGNSTSCYRRLNKELEKVGKVWKDKTYRIEPLQVEVEVGKPYYYISDKMEVVTEREKGTPTSHKRFLAGNYFTTHMAATKMLGKFNEMLRNYLASEKWPELD